MDESFSAKRFKSNQMINRATSRSEPTLHISEQFVGFEIPDKLTVNHSFHSLQMQLINDSLFVGSLPGFGIGMIIAFFQSEGKSSDIQILLKIIKERISVNVITVDNVFHVVPLR